MCSVRSLRRPTPHSCSQLAGTSSSSSEESLRMPACSAIHIISNEFNERPRRVATGSKVNDKKLCINLKTSHSCMIPDILPPCRQFSHFSTNCSYTVDLVLPPSVSARSSALTTSKRIRSLCLPLLLIDMHSSDKDYQSRTCYITGRGRHSSGLSKEEADSSQGGRTVRGHSDVTCMHSLMSIETRT